MSACILVGNVWLNPWRSKLSLLFPRTQDFSHNLFSSSSPPLVLKLPIYYTQDMNDMYKNLMSRFLLFVFNSKERLSFFLAWGFWGRWQINYKAWENCFQTTLEKNKKPLKPFDSALVSSKVLKKKNPSGLRNRGLTLEWAEIVMNKIHVKWKRFVCVHTGEIYRHLIVTFQ